MSHPLSWVALLLGAGFADALAMRQNSPIIRLIDEDGDGLALH